MIAALFVAANGPYMGLEGVDAWPESRDARTYPGPWPVVAHPPCERWGRYATGGPNPKARRRVIGDDGGCFESALLAVRAHGGVIEHPSGSHAWKRYGLPKPPRHGWRSHAGNHLWLKCKDGYLCAWCDAEAPLEIEAGKDGA